MNDDPMMAEVTSDDRLWAALTYVFSPAVPIILMLWEDKKNRPFIRAHNAQALILGIITILTSAACIGLLVWLYQLYCAYKAYQGEMVEVPVITNLVKNQGWA
jgi:uncharacterized membrane protein